MSNIGSNVIAVSRAAQCVGSARLERRVTERVALGRVDDALADSFPASDPPAWTPTSGARPAHRR